jgi:lipopolysaccharide/colanic/teichoic acid biosynthesis glycosyltransferase
MANENEFTPTRDYVTLYKKARQIGNLDEIDNIWNSLLKEVGIVDPQSEQAQAASGKLSAERMNARNTPGITGKKV